jgi:hypothetical protein
MLMARLDPEGIRIKNYCISRILDKIPAMTRHNLDIKSLEHMVSTLDTSIRVFERSALINFRAFSHVVERMMEKHHHHIHLTLAGLYGAWWYFIASKKTRLRTGRCHSLLARAISRCPTLHSTYYPSFLAATAFLQLQIGAARDFFYGYLPFVPTPYQRRDFLHLQDGQAVALDWMTPPEGSENLSPACPVAILCHGAFQSSHSGPMVSISQAIVRQLGCPVVVFNRRGYEFPLSVPRTYFYGSDEVGTTSSSSTNN